MIYNTQCRSANKIRPFTRCLYMRYTSYGTDWFVPNPFAWYLCYNLIDNYIPFYNIMNKYTKH